MRIGIFVLLLGLALGVHGHDDYEIGLSGVYLGIHGGGGKFTGEPYYNNMNLKTGDSINAYGGFIGYKVFNTQVTVALEAEYMKYSGDIKVDIYDIDHHFKAELDYSYTASLLIGYMAAETVEIYLRAGYGKTYIETRSGTAANPTIRDGKLEMPVGGLGVRFSNDSNIGLRFEYRYHFHDDYDISSGSDFKSNSDLLLVSLDYLI